MVNPTVHVSGCTSKTSKQGLVTIGRKNNELFNPQKLTYLQYTKVDGVLLTPFPPHRPPPTLATSFTHLLTYAKSGICYIDRLSK